jgi:exodeoxyribonuclease VII large subunit
MLLHRLAQRLDDVGQRMEETLGLHIRENARRVDALAATVLRHDPRQRIAFARHQFSAGYTRLERALERNMHEKRARLEKLTARLDSLSPLAVLERGYALVLTGQGSLVRSTQQITAGDILATRLSDGTFTSRVETTEAATQKKRRRK